MVQVVCAVRDAAVDSFMQPFFVVAPAVAVRSFYDEVQRDGSPMKSHPADYELFQIALFDEDAGRFENLDQPRALARGVDVSKGGAK